MSMALIRPKTPPLPPLRSTSEILADIDQQVGRLAIVRESAVELLRRIEHSEDDGDGEADGT